MTATNYKGSSDAQVTPGCNPNGLHTIHGPKGQKLWCNTKIDSGRPIVSIISVIPDDFGYGTSFIGNFISLPFQGVQERPNWMLYATWTSVLIWKAPR
jgi:hypothetical protein